MKPAGSIGPPIEADFRVCRPDLESLIELLSLRLGTVTERIVSEAGGPEKRSFYYN